MPRFPDDRSLAEGCRRGDRAAWDEFVARYARFIAYAVRRQMPSASEADVNDVVQNVFVELLKDDRKAWGRYDPKYRLTTWLGLVVLTQADRVTRARKPPPPPDRMQELTTEIAIPSEEVERLRAAMKTLGEKERLLLALYYQDGLGLKEIEKVTGIPAGTIGSHLFRARDKLKQALAEKKA
jgi:RNA polymerase sigma-70 factor (ECF subfamily)